MVESMNEGVGWDSSVCVLNLGFTSYSVLGEYMVLYTGFNWCGLLND